MLRYITAGESHGPALVAIIEGLPAGINVGSRHIDKELARRQLGLGRSARMKIEQDKVEILSGLRFGLTLGSPVALLIRNRVFSEWTEVMASEGAGSSVEPITAPRPGHADLAGLIKMGFSDIRNVLERASARETAARVAAGAMAKALLKQLSIEVVSHVTAIGEAKAEAGPPGPGDLGAVDASVVRCLDEAATAKMTALIEEASAGGDSLGGLFEVLVYGCPPGLGGYVSADDRLDGTLAGVVMSIPGIKGVEIGGGFESARTMGSQAHDEIFFNEERGFFRRTNRAGGIEGGMTNGEVVVVRAAMKPISTLQKPLKTADFVSKEPTVAFKERADVCAVPSAAVIGEAVVALEIAREVLEKFGGDSMADVSKRYQDYLGRIEK